MIQQYTLLFICAVLLSSSPILGQNTENSQKRTLCGKQAMSTETMAIAKVPNKRVNIQLPPNYKPPVADDKLITFPETVANKKKQKKLLKKRKNQKKRKKGKKQGCKQSHM